MARQLAKQANLLDGGGDARGADVVDGLTDALVVPTAATAAAAAEGAAASGGAATASEGEEEDEEDAEDEADA